MIACRDRPAVRPPLLTSVRLLAAALLAAHFLFAHGCHGDEDNELFGRAAVAGVGGEAAAPAAEY